MSVDGPTAALEATESTLATLSLPAGSYLIWAKAWFTNTGTAGTLTCTLSAGGQLDRNQLVIGASEIAAAAFVGVKTLAAAGQAHLACSSSGDLTVVTASDVKLVAVEVETLTAG